MRANLEDNLAKRLRHFSPRYETLTTVLSGSFIVPDDGPVFNFLDPNGANRTVFLPELPDVGGFMYLISNQGLGFDLEVVDADGVSIADLVPSQHGLFFGSPTEWAFIATISEEQITFLGEFLAEPEIVTGDHSVTDEIVVAIQKDNPAATAIGLPLLASRNGKPVSIVDFSTNVVDHTITITPADGTILGQLTWTLVSNAANLAFATFWPSVALNGWYMR